MQGGRFEGVTVVLRADSRRINAGCSERKRTKSRRRRTVTKCRKSLNSFVFTLSSAAGAEEQENRPQDAKTP